MIAQKLLYCGCIVYQITQLADYQSFFFRIVIQYTCQIIFNSPFVFHSLWNSRHGDAIVVWGWHTFERWIKFLFTNPLWIPQLFNGFQLTGLWLWHRLRRVPLCLYLCAISRVVKVSEILTIKIGSFLFFDWNIHIHATSYVFYASKVRIWLDDAYNNSTTKWGQHFQMI